MADTDNLWYCLPSDDIAVGETPTLVSGTQATGYPPENVGNEDPAYPFKVDSTTFRLVWDFGSAVAPKLVVLAHHNFAPGLTGVRFQMNATDVWTAPSFSAEFPAASYHLDKFPLTLHLDLRSSAPSYRYASLVVTSANTVNCAIGEVIISTAIRMLDGTVQFDSEEDEDHPLVEHQTDVGVSTIYRHGTRLRWLRGDKVVEATDAAAIRTWTRASLGRGLPFVVLPHLAETEAWYVRWENGKVPRTYIGPDLISRYRLAFAEVSRGLYPTPSAV
jgi:hypothetical protein